MGRYLRSLYESISKIWVHRSEAACDKREHFRSWRFSEPVAKYCLTGTDLGWAERTSFEVPTVSLHVHERIDPRSIIEAVRKKNGEDFVQGSLFSRLEENPPLREAVDFYKHKHNWSNRPIAGGSLLVMNSLLEKEVWRARFRWLISTRLMGSDTGPSFSPL